MLPRLLASFLAFAALAFAQDDYHLRSQNDPASGNARDDDPAALRILYIGNSITRHAPSENLSWHHTAGMAASAEANDYAHTFARLVQSHLPARKVQTLFHTYGGSGSVAHRLSALDRVLPLEPHVVVIQLGEHEKEPDGTALLRENYARLLTAFDQQPSPPLVLCIGNWGSTRDPAHPAAYAGWAGEIERAMREVASAHRKPFVSLVAAATNPAHRNWGEHPGVRWHPNDAGHAAYARLLFDAFRQHHR